MDEFLAKFDNVVRTCEEKKWLQDFYCDIEKYIYRKEIPSSVIEICCAVLTRVKTHRTKVNEPNKAYSWLPFKHSIAPIIKFIQKVKRVSTGHILEDNAHTAGSSSEVELTKETGFKSSQRVPYLLVGYLETKSEQGTLFLEDNTAVIPCELIRPADKKWLGKLVVILAYNYVPGPQSNTSQKEKDCEWMGYLEISWLCEAVLEPDDVLQIYPAALSLDQFLRRDRRQKRTLRVKITALSPVHIINTSKPFFLVRLSSQETTISVSMVVQGSYHMYWRNFLRIEEVFVFTDVRETSMNKGTKNERRVLASTRTSDFFRCTYEMRVNITTGGKRTVVAAEKPDLDTTNKAVIKRAKTETGSWSTEVESAAEAYLSGLNQSEDQQMMPAGAQERRVLPPKSTLSLSYSGIITKCIKAEAGMYELDSEYRLFLNHQPNVNMSRGLRVGARLTLHNVHLCTRDKKILGLCSCTRSTVRIDAFSSLASPWKPCKYNQSPLCLLGQELTIYDYIDLVHICDQLLRKFYPSFRTHQLISYSSHRQDHSGKRSVVECLLEEAKNKVKTATTRNKRNIYAEFFDEPHDCHPTRPSLLPLCRVLSLMEILEIVQSKVKGRPWNTGNDDSSDAPTEWCYQIFQRQQIDPMMTLLGCLRGSSNTGQLQLHDTTGAVDCVITSADYRIPGHCCLTDCCKKSVLTSQSGAATDGSHRSSSCPFAQIWHYDALIKLDEFQVVVEHFKVDPTLKDAHTFTFPGDEHSALRIYFQFSLEDAQILAQHGEVLPASPVVDAADGKTRAGLATKGEHGERCKPVEHTAKAAEQYNRGRDQFVTIAGNSKEREESAMEISDKELDARRSAAAHSAQGPRHLGNEIVCCVVLFLVRHTEDPTVRKFSDRLICTSCVDIKVVGWCCSESTHADRRTQNTGCASSVDVECKRLWSCLSDFNVQAKSSVLNIANSSIHWLRFLHPGCLYILREKSPDEDSSRILKVIKGRGRQVIEVTPEMDFERICSCDACLTSSSPRDSTVAPMEVSPEGGAFPREAGPECDSSIQSKPVSQAIEAVKRRFAEEDALMTVEGVLSASAQRDSLYCTKVGFRALVVSREMRLSEAPGPRRLPGEFVEIPKFGPVKTANIRGLGLGFCYLGNKTIHLKVQDIDSMNVMSVYIDLSRSQYICGIVPGALIQCRRFIRKFSCSGNIYCLYEACSSIVVEWRAPPDISRVSATKFPVPSNLGEHSRLLESRTSAEERKTAQVPNRYIIELIRSDSEGVLIQTISRLRCRVIAVQRAKVSWKCARCGGLVMKEECTGACVGTKDCRFGAEARCVIEDGTGEAQLYLYDDIVASLLQLSSQQWSQLRDMSMNAGELLYQRAWHGAENPRLQTDNSGPCSRATQAKLSWARYCCSPSLPRLVAVFCKQFRVGGRETGSTTGFESRSVTVGGSEHSTLVLPRLMLKAVDFMEVRASQDARLLLDMLQRASV